MILFKLVNLKFRDIVDIPTLYIDRKKITTITGYSGSGKTTFLKLLNKMLSPTEGSIMYNNVDLDKINTINYRKEVTMLSQNSVMFEGNIRDNLNMGLKFQRKPLKNDNELYNILEIVKINKSLDISANTLSKDDMQRVALARVLILNPSVYLLDEPSVALEPPIGDKIVDIIVKHVKEEDKTLIMVNNSSSIAEKYSDSIIEL